MLRRSVLPLARRAFPRSTATIVPDPTSTAQRFTCRSTFVHRTQRRRHVIAALVVNQPGCLAEIANLFAARGYNIDSLVVGRTEVEELSRMTVVVNGTAESVVNMKKQLEDVVYVAVVNILSSGKNAEKNYVERDLMLAKVGVIAMARSTSVTDKLGDLSTFEGATRTLLDEADDVEVDISRLPPG
eukprot:jgi/Phyca11/547990/estExt2_Genewise1Plus.C_PHYCAscaffold_270181